MPPMPMLRQSSILDERVLNGLRENLLLLRSAYFEARFKPFKPWKKVSRNVFGADAASKWSLLATIFISA